MMASKPQPEPRRAGVSMLKEARDLARAQSKAIDDELIARLSFERIAGVLDREYKWRRWLQRQERRNDDGIH